MYTSEHSPITFIVRFPMTRKALICAVNAYPQSPLQGCINDAQDWSNTLTGFIKMVLIDSLATKNNILAGLNWLISGAVAGDSLVFEFSGHGSKVRDTSGDEPDGYDEILCSVDFFSGKYVKDDDIRAILNNLPAGVTLDVFLDCCYSGSATRSVDFTITTPRCIPGPKTKGKIANRVVTLVPTLNHVLWSGCADSQTSGEGTVGGVKRGLFSYYMCKAIRAGGIRSDLIAKVQASVAAKNPTQTPQLECTQSESLEHPFQ
jgi:hypothetical protein